MKSFFTIVFSFFVFAVKFVVVVTIPDKVKNLIYEMQYNFVNLQLKK